MRTRRLGTVAVIELPPVGTHVLATLEHGHNKKKFLMELVRVDEGDCDWRTPDDNSEVSYDWDVVDWVAIPSEWIDKVRALAVRGKGMHDVCYCCGALKQIAEIVRKHKDVPQCPHGGRLNQISGMCEGDCSKK